MTQIPFDPHALRRDFPADSRLSHWIAENAKTTRALLKRIDALVPLAQPLQVVSIVELPRPAKGSRDSRVVVVEPLSGARAGGRLPSRASARISLSLSLWLGRACTPAEARHIHHPLRLHPGTCPS